MKSDRNHYQKYISVNGNNNREIRLKMGKYGKCGKVRQVRQVRESAGI